jgi:hypothetical protein
LQTHARKLLKFIDIYRRRSPARPEHDVDQTLCQKETEGGDID